MNLSDISSQLAACLAVKHSHLMKRISLAQGFQREIAAIPGPVYDSHQFREVGLDLCQVTA